MRPSHTSTLNVVQLCEIRSIPEPAAAATVAAASMIDGGGGINEIMNAAAAKA